MSNCRSCKAEILWVKMADSANWAPLDITPVAEGNIAVAGMTARVLTGEQLDRDRADGTKLYVSHFATCPNANHHRVDPHSRLFHMMRESGAKRWITNAQKALLHVAKTQLKLSEDAWRDLLRAEAGVTSARELDNRGCDRVLRRLERAGFHNTSARRRRDRQPGALITPEQQQLIAELFAQLGWTEKPRQMGFSKRCCRKSFPQTRSDANKVIEGLKAIIKRASCAGACPPE